MKKQAVAAVALAMCWLGFSAPASQAVVYSDSNVTGKYAPAVGCDADAVTKRSVYLKDRWGSVVGYLELRYSVTCHAAWARLTNFYEYVPYDQHSATATIVRDTDGKSFSCSTPPGTNQYCFTKMVFDLDPRTAHAEAEIDPYPDYYSPWIYGETTSY